MLATSAVPQDRASLSLGDPPDQGPPRGSPVAARAAGRGGGRHPGGAPWGPMSDSKAELLVYLQRGREAVVWKLEGASELDVRRPLTPTGTNLLGLVKHLTAVDAGYLGQVFGRPFP